MGRRPLVTIGAALLIAVGVTTLLYRPLVTGRTALSECGQTGASADHLIEQPGVYAVLAQEGRARPPTAIFFDDGRLVLADPLGKYRTFSIDAAATKRDLALTGIHALDAGCYVTWSPLYTTHQDPGRLWTKDERGTREYGFRAIRGRAAALDRAIALLWSRVAPFERAPAPTLKDRPTSAEACGDLAIGKTRPPDPAGAFTILETRSGATKILAFHPDGRIVETVGSSFRRERRVDAAAVEKARKAIAASGLALLDPGCHSLGAGSPAHRASLRIWLFEGGPPREYGFLQHDAKAGAVEDAWQALDQLDRSSR